MRRNFGVALAKFNPICFVREVRKLVLLTILWVAAQTTAWSAPREIKPPPVGDTIKVEVMRGSAVPITLKAFERRGNPLAYEIAREPRHGALTNFRQADKNKQGFASVIYQHGDDEDSTSDEFTFRARGLLGGGVSSPIKVMVEIVDAAPVFQITPGVDFTAIAGETDRQQIILANQGGGVISGRVAPKEPFEVEGDGKFLLRRGQITNMVVRFSPDHTGPVAPQRLVPAPTQRSIKIELRGKSLPPFTAAADPLERQSDDSRTGTIRISNFCAYPFAVRLAATPDDLLDMPSIYELDASSKVGIPVTIGADKKGGGEKISITVSNDRHEEPLTLMAEAIPPRMSVEPRELDFREQSEATLILRNTGGTQGTYELSLPPDVASDPQESSFTLAAGTKRSVRLRFKLSGSEQADGAAHVQLGDEPKILLPVLRPASLTVLTESLDFRKSSDERLVVENTGDADGKFVLQLPRGLVVDGPAGPWTVRAREKTIVPLRREPLDGTIEPLHVTVDGVQNVRRRVKIILNDAREPVFNYPWQLNKDIVCSKSNGEVRVKWRSEKKSWRNAVLEKADGSGPYAPEAETVQVGLFSNIVAWVTGHTERIVAWVTGHTERTIAAVEEKKEFFNKRLEVPGEEAAGQQAEPPRDATWQSVLIAPGDLERKDMIWRITAQGDDSEERKPVSVDFRLGGDENLIPLPPPEAADEAKPPVLIEEEILILGQRYEGRDLTLTVGLPTKSRTSDFVVEQITGLVVPDKNAPHAVRYMIRELPESMATIVSSGTAKSNTIQLSTVTVLFRNLPRGEAFLCRLVPAQSGAEAIPTAPFQVAGPPLQAVPWKLMLVAALVVISFWLVRERLRSRAC